MFQKYYSVLFLILLQILIYLHSIDSSTFGTKRNKSDSSSSSSKNLNGSNSQFGFFANDSTPKVSKISAHQHSGKLGLPINSSVTLQKKTRLRWERSKRKRILGNPCQLQGESKIIYESFDSKSCSDNPAIYKALDYAAHLIFQDEKFSCRQNFVYIPAALATMVIVDGKQPELETWWYLTRFKGKILLMTFVRNNHWACLVLYTTKKQAIYFDGNCTKSKTDLSPADEGLQNFLTILEERNRKIKTKDDVLDTTNWTLLLGNVVLPIGISNNCALNSVLFMNCIINNQLKLNSLEAYRQEIQNGIFEIIKEFQFV